MAVTGDSFYGAPATAPTGLAPNEVAVQFTTDASVPAGAQGEMVALSLEVKPTVGANLGGGVEVTVKGRWIDGSGATQTFPGGLDVRADYKRTLTQTPFKAQVVEMLQILLGDPAATGAPGVYPLATMIAAAKGLPALPTTPASFL